MQKEDKLFLLLLQIHSDGDFYWKLKTFPEEKDEHGYRMDEVCIYLKNPTESDIRKILFQIADEFADSFDGKEYYMDLKDKYVQEFKDEHNISRLLKYGEFYKEYGNQSLSVHLIPYVTKTIKIHNTDEIVEIVSACAVSVRPVSGT